MPNPKISLAFDVIEQDWHWSAVVLEDLHAPFTRNSTTRACLFWLLQLFHYESKSQSQKPLFRSFFWILGQSEKATKAEV